MGCYFLLQRIVLTQGSNPHLLHWQEDSLLLCHLGSPSKCPDVNCCCCCAVTKSGLTLCGPMDCSAPDFLVPHHLLEFAQADLTYLQKRCIPLKCNNNHNKISYVTHLFTISQVNCLKMDRSSLNSDPKWIVPLPGS